MMIKCDDVGHAYNPDDVDQVCLRCKEKKMTDPIKAAIEALKYTDKRHDKIRNALDFIRYGSAAKIQPLDGQALADAGNNLSAARHELNEALTLLRQAQETHVMVPRIPDGLIDRIKAAERRIKNGHAPMQIPANPEDVDLVLAEVRLWLEEQRQPHWLAATSEQDKGGK